MNKPVEFFDEPNNSSGNLTSFLSSEVEAINGASIEHYLTVYQGLVSMAVCTVFSFIFNIVIGIYGLVTFPISCYAIYYQNSLHTIDSETARTKNDSEKAMISDLIGNHRTVQSLSNQEYLVSKHFDNSNEDFINSLKHSFIYAFTMYWSYNYTLPMIYYMASRFESDKFYNDRDYESYYISYIMILKAGLIASVSFFNAPNFNKGKPKQHTFYHLLLWKFVDIP